MSEFDEELRGRHSFVEETADGMLDLFDRMSPEDHEAFGDRVETFSHYAGNIIMPEICDGIVSIPEEYRDSDALPVVVLKPGETVSLGPEFYVPTATGWQNALRRIAEWGPRDSTPDEDGHTIRQGVYDYLDSAPRVQISSLRDSQLASVDTIAVGMDVKAASFANLSDDVQKVSGDWQSVVLKGRPFLRMQPQPGHNPVSSFVHELEHVYQTLSSPWRFDLPKDDPEAAKRAEKEYTLRDEMPAYYRGASVARARQRLGYELTPKDQDDIDIDDIRMKYASSPDDFTPRNLDVRARYLLKGYSV